MVHNKFNIAVEHLECAILLFLDNKYFSALTLAGASEEILGGFIREYTLKDTSLRKVSSLIKMKACPDSSTNSVINMLNSAKNAAKHPDDIKRNFAPEMECEIREEAMVLILRALSNYCSFEQCKVDDIANVYKYLKVVDEDPLMKVELNFL